MENVITKEKAIDIMSRIDHTQLKAFATWEDIKSLCDEAVLYKTASVCIPPGYVKKVKDTYVETLKICTVIGFPLGYSTGAVKLFETENALMQGADEIDMVINVTDVKNGDFNAVSNEISAMRKVTANKILKVIVETCYLNEKEKTELCHIVTDTGADYIKTSTGFGTAGAVIDDIKLFKENIGPDVKIKAAGGIRTIEDAVAMVDSGADRIGSSAVAPLLWEIYCL